MELAFPHSREHETREKTRAALVPLRLKREAAMTQRIEINPRVMQGKPVIKGTRVPVELLLRKLSEGATTPELLDAYPRLTADDILAALSYAADTIAHETILELTT
jgi:uncharacterized protein (DUF433 family)